MQVEKDCCQQEFASLKRCFYKEVGPVALSEMFTAQHCGGKSRQLASLHCSSNVTSCIVQRCLAPADAWCSSDQCLLVLILPAV
jgi:hypothetical protein